MWKVPARWPRRSISRWRRPAPATSTRNWQIENALGTRDLFDRRGRTLFHRDIGRTFVAQFLAWPADAEVRVNALVHLAKGETLLDLAERCDGDAPGLLGDYQGEAVGFLGDANRGAVAGSQSSGESRVC